MILDQTRLLSVSLMMIFTPTFSTCTTLLLIFAAIPWAHGNDEIAQKAAAKPTSTLRAGTGKVDITDYDAGPVNDPSYVKAVAISDGSKTAVIITVDAVAIGGIGRIGISICQTCELS